VDYERPNGGIIFPNPNAPTGMGLPLAPIRQLLQRNRHSVVLVDEAYIDFGGQSAVSLVKEFDNLLVVQTVSKSRALAGLRVGYAIGHAGLIEALDRVKNSFNSYPVDRLAELAVIASFGDEDWFQASRAKVIASRDYTSRELTALGFEVLPSQANFIFARPSGLSAQRVFEGLRQRNILVRYFNKPRISEFLRISIGAQHEMEALVTALQDILASTR
jgi:histidinol-phosphate aminotransferase